MKDFAPKPFILHRWAMGLVSLGEFESIDVAKEHASQRVVLNDDPFSPFFGKQLKYDEIRWRTFNSNRIDGYIRVSGQDVTPYPTFTISSQWIEMPKV